MSAVIKTTTPFVIEEVLIEALTVVGVAPQKVTPALFSQVSDDYKVKIGDILTSRLDYNGIQLFRWQGARWALLHDSDESSATLGGSRYTQKQYISVARFISDVNLAYISAYEQYIAKLAEKERVRLEEERRARVEATRLQAIEKAKLQGYSVKESRNSKGQIQLVLTRMG